MELGADWGTASQVGWFALGLLVLTVVTMSLARAAAVGLGWTPLTAMLRAGLQLSVVAVLLRGVLSVGWTVVAFVVLMLTTASLTSASRLKSLWHGRTSACAGVLTGALVGVGAVLTLRLVPLEPRQVVAVAGILIGNAMTAATLSGRNFLRESTNRRDEVEAWLSLGATPIQAHAEIARQAVRESLLPTLDQTRSTGMVTLPGAFVGAVFAGASPRVAAQFQLVVLAGIALTMLVTGLVTVYLLSRTPYLPTGPEAAKT